MDTIGDQPVQAVISDSSKGNPEQGITAQPHTLVDVPPEEKSPKSIKAKIKHYCGKYWRGEMTACALFSLLMCCGGCIGLMPVWIGLPDRFKRTRGPWALIGLITVITFWTFSMFMALVPVYKELAMEFGIPFPDLQDPAQAHLIQQQMQAFLAALQNLPPDQKAHTKEVMEAFLVSWGAISFDALRRGFVWAFVSHAFIHASALHWGLNMIAMAVGGLKLNQLIGHTQFCVMFLIAAIGGATTQFAFAPLEDMVGASGAIMGIYGAFCCIVVMYWEKLKAAKVTMMIVFTTLVLINIQQQVVGHKFMGNEIGSLAHLGGFVSGALYVVAFGPCTWNQEFAKVYRERIGKVGKRVSIVVLALFLLVPGVICIIRANNL